MKKIIQEKRVKTKGGFKMRSRGILGLILGLMLAVVMGSNVYAQPELCSSDFPDGIVSAGSIDTAIDLGETGFVAGLLGTQEVFNGDIIGGLDWLYNNELLASPNFPTTEVGTQVVAWWTLDNGRESWVQVTNTNPALATEVHVVILDELCDEVINFCDTLTPNDTAVYELSNLVRNSNTGGAPVPGGTTLTGEGTIVVTPTVNCSEAAPFNFPAIEFNYLQATTTIIDEDVDFGVNAYARWANGDGCEENLLDEVNDADDSDANNDDDSDGIIDGTTIDTNAGGGLLTGTFINTNDPDDLGDDTVEGQDCAFQTILPTSLTKDYSTIGDGPAAADLVFLQFIDNYDALVAGLGYLPEPLISEFIGSIVNIDENAGSCGDVTGCFLRLGIDTVNQLSDNVDLNPAPGVEECDGADGDEDGLVDCLDPDCDLAEICENGDAGECSDGEDGDGDGDTDCADDGCDGELGPSGEVCEPGTETTCDDGFDNDGDGDADDADADCQVVGDDDDDDDDDGGGDGCGSVVGTTSSTSAAVNFLLPMMVFGLGLMVRRFRRKK